MSQRAASNESFVPFNPAPAGAATPSAPPPVPGPSNVKVSARGEPKLEFTPLEPRASAHAPGHAGPAEPVITLQRDGDRVMSIRIECPCGQVIDLACRYENNALAP